MARPNFHQLWDAASKTVCFRLNGAHSNSRYLVLRLAGRVE
jgi:hypothetical protein